MPLNNDVDLRMGNKEPSMVLEDIGVFRSNNILVIGKVNSVVSLKSLKLCPFLGESL